MLELLKSSARQFVEKNGRSIADALTISRIVGSPFVARLQLVGEKYNASCLHGLLSGTDWLDGYIIRRSREGGTKKGARLDKIGDKTLSVARETSLMITRDLPQIHFFIRTGRELILFLAEIHYKKLGVDTKANLGGKISTTITSCADTITPHVGNPGLKRALDSTATGAKVASGIYNLYSWRQEARQLNNR